MYLRYSFYILVWESHSIGVTMPAVSPSGEPCVGSAPEPNIESVLLNVAIKERVVEKCGKNTR